MTWTAFAKYNTSFTEHIMAEASVEPEEGVTKQVSLCLKKRPYRVTLTEIEFRWQEENGKKTSQTVVRVRDIVSVRCEGKPDAGDSTSTLTLVYITQEKNYMLKRRSVSFSGDALKCDAMCKEVQNSLDAVRDRPQKLLVLINPVSGRSKGPEVYKNKIAPIFEEANIVTDVIVTQKAHHTEEIIASYDLTSIHAVVLVGGDGFYHEYTNGIVRRMASDAGHDVNNPDYRPPEISLPVGLIPCGTGNGIVRGALGNYDIISAAYSIVLGYRKKNNMFSIFCGEELLAYSILLCGYGVWGDLVYASETRRSQGRMRYAVAMIETLLMKPYRMMNLTVSYRCRPDVDVINQGRFAEYLQPQDIATSSDQQKIDSPMSSDKGTTESASTSVAPDGQKTDMASSVNIEKTPEFAEADDWKKASVDEPKSVGASSAHSRSEMKSFSGNFVAIFTPVAYFGQPFEEWSLEKLGFDNVNDLPTTVLTNSTSKMALLKMMYKLFAPGDTYGGSAPFLVANEWKVKLNNPDNPETDIGRKQLIFNVDGDIFYLKKTEFHIRMFEERIPTFCNAPKVTKRLPAKK